MAPSEAVGDAIGRLTAGDGEYCVVAHEMYETAMAQARAADDAVAKGEALGPLHGVPIGVKDLYDIAGQPTSAGATILADNIADATATAAKNLQAAGAVVVAKTTMTEFAGTSHHPALPTPVNPYDRTRSPAGSSSGSAVAVAAGLLPAALGSDTVASIRLPAAWNGCVGFKPSYGRVSRHGVFALAVTYDHCGPLTQTVSDADLVTRAIAGADPLDATTRSDPYGDHLDGVAGMRIGWDEAFATERVHPEIAAASRAAIAALADAGAEIVDVTIPLRTEAAGPYYTLLRAEIAAAHRALWPERRAEYTTSFAGILASAAEVHCDDVVHAHEFRIEHHSDAVSVGRPTTQTDDTRFEIDALPRQTERLARPQSLYEAQRNSSCISLATHGEELRHLSRTERAALHPGHAWRTHLLGDVVVSEPEVHRLLEHLGKQRTNVTGTRWRTRLRQVRYHHGDLVGPQLPNRNVSQPGADQSQLLVVGRPRRDPPFAVPHPTEPQIDPSLRVTLRVTLQERP